MTKGDFYKLKSYIETSYKKNRLLKAFFHKKWLLKAIFARLSK